MTRRYSVLQKKLRELESQLSNLFSIASYGTSSRPDMEDVAHNLAFLKNLLSAEVASSPSKPHHLLHISQRLSVLESAIRDCRNSEPMAADDFGGSICSCTESCLNDDGEAGYEEDDEIVDLCGSLGENEGVEEINRLAEDDQRKGERVGEEKRKGLAGEGRGRRRCYGAMAIGVVFGMVLVSCTVASTGLQKISESGNLLTPT